MSQGDPPTNPPRKRRRWLRALFTTALTTAWLAYMATWLVAVKRIEASEQRFEPGICGRPTYFHHWSAAVGSGVFSYRRATDPDNFGRTWLSDVIDDSTKTRLYHVVDAERHWMETWVAYASSTPAFAPNPGAGTLPIVTRERVTVIDHLERTTPSIVLLVPTRLAPFTWRSFWLWDYSSRDGIDITFPLWPPLLITTLIWGRSWYVNIRASRRIHRGTCVKCGYLRKGLAPDASCPECGTRRPGEATA